MVLTGWAQLRACLLGSLPISRLLITKPGAQFVPVYTPKITIDFPEARFWIASGCATIRQDGEYEREPGLFRDASAISIAA